MNSVLPFLRYNGYEDNQLCVAVVRNAQFSSVQRSYSTMRQSYGAC